MKTYFPHEKLVEENLSVVATCKILMKKDFFTKHFLMYATIFFSGTFLKNNMQTEVMAINARKLIIQLN